MAAVDLDQVQALLAGCRLDLATMRRDLALPDPLPDRTGPAAAGILDGRLLDLVDRLDRVAASLEQARQRLDRAPVPAPDDEPGGEAGRGAAGNLRTVSELLARQVDRGGSLRNAGLRARAVARIHESLRLAARLNGMPRSIELAAYVKSICDGYRSVPVPVPMPASLPAQGAAGPALCVYMVPVQVAPELARQVGLVVMELVGNALRHAFAPDRPGRIWVVGYHMPDGRYLLCVEDDGRGLPSGFDLRARPDGTGLGLVNLLVDRARLDLACDGRGGAWFVLAVPASRIRQAANPGW